MLDPLVQLATVGIAGVASGDEDATGAAGDTADFLTLGSKLSDTAINAALAAARANGGGTVLLSRGQYYIDGPIVVPNGNNVNRTTESGRIVIEDRTCKKKKKKPQKKCKG